MASPVRRTGTGYDRRYSSHS